MLRNHRFCFGFGKENCPELTTLWSAETAETGSPPGIAVFPTEHPSNCTVNPNEHRVPPGKAARLTAVPANFTQACGDSEL